MDRLRAFTLEDYAQQRPESEAPLLVGASGQEFIEYLGAHRCSTRGAKATALKRGY